MNIEPISLDMIEADPDQPRKYFDDAKLQELAVSIKEHGVQQPIKVRPHPTKGVGHYMLVFGERRWRASEIAGVDTIPTIVEDVEHAGLVLERQLIENSQRVDIGALEEGETYLRLKKQYGHTIETLMARTGKGRSHVYARMKLTDLAPTAKKAMQEGKLTPAIADLAATIGDGKLQEQYVREVLGKLDGVRLDELNAAGIHHELVSDKEQYTRDEDVQPLSYRAAKALLRRRYSTRLSLAKFDPQDATLTPAGACGPCPHRSGNQPELPGMTNGASAEDVCTKTSCFEEKTKATWKRVAANAKDNGTEILDATDAKRVFSHDGVSVVSTSPYVALDQELPYDLAKSPGKPQTFGKLLGKRAAEIPRVLVQDGAGAPRELIDRAKAVEVLRELGKVEKLPPKPATSERSASAKLRKAESDHVELRNRALEKMAAAAIVESSKDLGKREVAWLRWIVEWVLELVEPNLQENSAVVQGLDKKKPWKQQLLDRATTTVKMRQLLTGLLFADVIASSTNDPDRKGLIMTGVNLLGIDPYKTVQAAIKESDEIEDKLSAAKRSKGKQCLVVEYGKRCTLPLLHDGQHTDGITKWDAPGSMAKRKPATDDGKRCGIVNGRKGDGCIHDQGHEGAHSNGWQTWPNKPAKKGTK